MNIPILNQQINKYNKLINILNSHKHLNNN